MLKILTMKQNKDVKMVEKFDMDRLYRLDLVDMIWTDYTG